MAKTNKHLRRVTSASAFMEKRCSKNKETGQKFSSCQQPLKGTNYPIFSLSSSRLYLLCKQLWLNTFNISKQRHITRWTNSTNILFSWVTLRCFGLQSLRKWPAVLHLPSQISSSVAGLPARPNLIKCRPQTILSCLIFEPILCIQVLSSIHDIIKVNIWVKFEKMETNWFILSVFGLF